MDYSSIKRGTDIALRILTAYAIIQTYGFLVFNRAYERWDSNMREEVVNCIEGQGLVSRIMTFGPEKGIQLARMQHEKDSGNLT